MECKQEKCESNLYNLTQGVKGHATIYTSEGESLEIEAIIIYMSLN